QVLWRGAWAKARARNGDVSSAERVAREAVTLAFRTDVLELRASTLLDLGEVLRTAGRLDDARASMGDALDLYERKEHYAGVDRARRMLAQLDVRPSDSRPEQRQ